MTPRATYRFQFHKDFPFARAEELVPYLDRLGISHVYASPITVATPGSQHGYDVVDPTRINPELGGEEALRSLVAALRALGMGLIIDIVPNHMGIASGHNAWWNDVLRHGRESDFAHYFDIDWRAPVLLPILGSPLRDALTAGDIAIDRTDEEPAITAYGEHRVPIRPEDHAKLPIDGDLQGLSALLERQHYRLGWWRTANDELNWRRFFTINELAGLRVEDDDVFEATHALYFRLWQEGLIDGVRIDHVDGLTDPAGYCRKLRARFDALPRSGNSAGERAYIVVEKILGPDEQLPTDWGMDGTSGYDFMEEVSALLHDPAGAEPLEKLWRDFSVRHLSFEEEELQARQDMLGWAFEGQLSACVSALCKLAASDPHTAGFTPAMLRRAIVRMLWVFPVYRTYGDGKSAPETDAAVRETVRHAAARFSPPGEAGIVDLILSWLSGTGPGDADLAAEAVRRFQQLSAPIAAKAVEDTAFYRYSVMLSRLDVGFDASHMGSDLKHFHQKCERRAASFPNAMLATATHDHKRGEDVRARLAMLSSIPELWRERVEAWDRMADGTASGVVAADRYALYQMMFGSWPDGLAPDDEKRLSAYADRLIAWQQKALREAKLRSSWEQPDEGYEAATQQFARTLLDPTHSADFAATIAAFVEETAKATLCNMLVQAGLHYTVPGMPDCYQGCELPDYSMVDPDNRRPVDYSRRLVMFNGDEPSNPKFSLISELLRLRRQSPRLFADGNYEPVKVIGPRANHVLAFERNEDNRILQCAFAIRCAEPLLRFDKQVPETAWWADTQVAFSQGGSRSAAELFEQLPVSVCVSESMSS